MLPRFGWKALPLALQLCKPSSPVHQICKQSPFSTLSSRLCRTVITSYKSAVQIPSLKIHTSSHHLKKRNIQEDPESRELDLLRYDMRAIKDSPKPALYLGLGSLIPFVAPPIMMSAMDCYCADLAFAQVAYGACMLSFLGGIRWGFAIPESSPAKLDWMNLANSKVPALVAWLALLLRENVTESALLVVMGLGITLHYDLSLLPTYPAWFKALRALLTLIAIASLIATLTISSVLPHKSLIRRGS
ncbi:transmembrane protein 69 [Pelodytes ibericus]